MLPPFCDELNINYGETCSRRATVRMVGGRNNGLCFCTQHAPKRNRYARAILSTRNVYTPTHTRYVRNAQGKTVQIIITATKIGSRPITLHSTHKER